MVPRLMGTALPVQLDALQGELADARVSPGFDKACGRLSRLG
jgi:hypothetical protein